MDALPLWYAFDVIAPDAPLACPIDGLPLQAEQRSWRCEAGHQFDLSRHGYLNLLPASQKPSKDPGDSKTMVAARRAVLDTGLYAGVADGVADSLATRLDARARCGQDPSLIVDAGCGEGYYTHRLHERVSESAARRPVSIIGVDISKWSIQAAARRYRDISWLVGNNKHLPILAGAADIITSLFGFETWKPWAERQRPGQSVLVVQAGARHLIELRELIYEQVRMQTPGPSMHALHAGYRLSDEHALSDTVILPDADAARNILAMTPHGHRIAAERASCVEAGIDQMSGSPLTLDIVLRWYERV